MMVVVILKSVLFNTSALLGYVCFGNFKILKSGTKYNLNQSWSGILSFKHGSVTLIEAVTQRWYQNLSI
jgi:hypothetical protein